MPRCNHCMKWILGGIREDDLRFCSTKCHEEGYLHKLVEGIDDDLLLDIVRGIHQQACSKCGNAGPVDVYSRHTATAFVIHFTWKDSPEVCCRRCGIRHITRGIAWTLFFGWWHFPVGIVAAPWQILKGCKQLISLPDLASPSQNLTNMVKRDLARRVSARSR